MLEYCLERSTEAEFEKLKAGIKLPLVIRLKTPTGNKWTMFAIMLKQQNPDFKSQ